MKYLILVPILIFGLSSCVTITKNSVGDPGFEAHVAKVSSEASSKGLPRTFHLSKRLELGREFSLPAGRYRAADKKGLGKSSFYVYFNDNAGVTIQGRRVWGGVVWYPSDPHPKAIWHQVGELGVRESEVAGLEAIKNG